GIRSASLIHRETNIPLSTICYNIDKLKQTGSLKHRGENRRPRVPGGKEKKLLVNTFVSTSTISRHLHKYGYKNVLPQSTHMLTSDEKQRRVQ
ncbi:unnamed protein product, partial [Rotaria sordida]